MKNLKDILKPDEFIFAQWLALKLPYLLDLFDFEDDENACYLPDRVDEYIDVASHGEAIMARFVISVWSHQNLLDFDHIDAARTLDAENMKIITDWLNEPFWPG